MKMSFKIFNQRTIIIVLLLILYPVSFVASDMGDFSIDFEITATPIHEWIPIPEYNPIDNEFLVLWFENGAREEGGENMYNISAQRISPNGAFIGDSFIPILSISPERKTLPTPAHNIYTNEYMIVLAKDKKLAVAIIKGNGTLVSDAVFISENPTTHSHPTIVFNSVRRQYLITWNDNRNGNADIFGIIVDEDGEIIKETFEISNEKGEQINPYSCYNPTDDTYLVNWEDFRHVSTWTENSNIYGTLLNGDGTFKTNDIPMCEDFGMEDEGDQRHNNIAYNSDRNEFLVSWTDMRPSLNNVGIVGRVINSDGTLGEKELVLADAPEAQIFPHFVYVKERKMYFAIWEDNRNDAPDTYWRDAANLDIYAQWFTSTGKAVGSDFPICMDEGVQRYSRVVYNPLMERFLVVWQDVVDEEVVGADEGHIKEAGGNILGAVYGASSFLLGQVVAQESGNPLNEAWVLILGPSLPLLKTTNNGGWFNIAERFQLPGLYMVIVFKAGFQIAFELINYTGETLQTTIELNAR
jgi:hypothetical protein